MNLGKVFNIFKKGASSASGQKGKKAGSGGISWPPGIRIGLYGHSNAGKTVYLTVLNEECKISKDLQISVIDNATAGEFLSNYRNDLGVGQWLQRRRDRGRYAGRKEISGIDIIRQNTPVQCHIGSQETGLGCYLRL